MKPKPIFRAMFAVLVVVGSLFVLRGAFKVSAENLQHAKTSAAKGDSKKSNSSNNEFIFLESVSKFFAIALIR
jgi:hypothetical protein